jgi:biotin carboxylase
LVEAAKLAEKLGLLHVNVQSAMLLRDKFSVRERLEQKGISQPRFALATSNEAILDAIGTVGLPALIKPSDGYGSQNIITLKDEVDLDLCKDLLINLLPMAYNYGLGVKSNDRLLIETYMEGQFIGCDTFSLNGRHQLLGVNEKLMFEPPLFAIKGGCFIPNQGQWPELEKYVIQILEAVEFNCGAAHIEIMLTEHGPKLVELNPRLVGAKIAKLMSYALGHSVHEWLIELHLGNWPLERLDTDKFNHAVTRWFAAPFEGVLEQVDLPTHPPSQVKFVQVLAKKGQRVFPPFENAHRLGYVMSADENRDKAEKIADAFIDATNVLIQA